MAATTVRVGRDVKRRLDKLQRALQTRSGRKVSHSELLDRLARYADRNQADFFESGEDVWKPPGRAALDRILAEVGNWGVATDAANEIDDVVYGDPHGLRRGRKRAR